MVCRFERTDPRVLGMILKLGMTRSARYANSRGMANVALRGASVMLSDSEIRFFTSFRMSKDMQNDKACLFQKARGTMKNI